MSKQEVFPRTNAQRWLDTHTQSLSLSPSPSFPLLPLYYDCMQIHKQATCLSIISCLFMESFTGKKKGKLTKAEVNTADIDPMRLTHTQTILLVYPGFVQTVPFNITAV